LGQIELLADFVGVDADVTPGTTLAVQEVAASLRHHTTASTEVAVDERLTEVERAVFLALRTATRLRSLATDERLVRQADRLETLASNLPPEPHTPGGLPELELLQLSDDLVAELHEATARNRELLAALLRLEESRSWRLTRPLRRIRHWREGLRFVSKLGSLRP
jgi:hypothetical protein